MISFHFKYKFESYSAQANIKLTNGKMVCELLGVLSDDTHQAVSFNNADMYSLMKEKNALTDAIEAGLSKYLDNFPVEHCKSVQVL